MGLFASICLLLLPAALWGQYKADAAGTPPADLKREIAATLNQRGFLVTNNGAKYCALWFETKLPQGATPGEPNSAVANVTLSEVATGALLGVIRFDAQGEDRRGQTIEPGLYMLRYARLPSNGDHEGAAQQRDFLVLTPASEDRDAAAPRNFDALVALSLKASHTRHPAVLSFWRADSDSPGFSQMSDTDWVLQTAIGETPVSVIVVGTSGS